ncbi:MAG: TolC family protein, partial [Porphyromonas sp.]|nr:TolC family protein [Porphyromonas sp.]
PEISFETKEAPSSGQLPPNGAIPNPADMFVFPVIPKDQYQALIEASQLIWDGGQVAAARKRVGAESEQQVRQIEVQIRDLQQRVYTVYFGLLITDAQRELQSLLIEELGRQKERVTSAMSSGTASQNDLDEVQIELLRADQQLEQIEANRAALIEALSLYMGRELPLDIVPVEPTPLPQADGTYDNHPQIALINGQERVLQAEWQQYTSKLLPAIALFARGGYGKPGLNMFDPDWQPIFIGGIQFKWQLGEFYNYSAEQKQRNKQLQLIDLKRQAFHQEISVARQKKEKEIDQYRLLLEKDREITQLLEKIKQRAEVQLDNGTLSQLEFLQKLTQYNSARQTEILHRLQYLKAQYELKLL